MSDFGSDDSKSLLDHEWGLRLHHPDHVPEPLRQDNERFGCKNPQCDYPGLFDAFTLECPYFPDYKIVDVACSGTVALALARIRAGQGTHLLALGSYHGSGVGFDHHTTVLSTTGSFLSKTWRGLEQIAPFPYGTREQLATAEWHELEDRCVHMLLFLVAFHALIRNNRVRSLTFELVLSDIGLMLSTRFLLKVQRVANEHGFLLIVDEVTSAFRTADELLLTYTHDGFKPHTESELRSRIPETNNPILPKPKN